MCVYVSIFGHVCPSPFMGLVLCGASTCLCMRAPLTKDGQGAHPFGEEIRTNIVHDMLHGAGSAEGVLRVSPNREQEPMVHDTADIKITYCASNFLINVVCLSH
jgi:hypothetical protein